MAYISADIKLPEAALSIHTQLYFPSDLPDAVGNETKGVIWLLHGMGNTPADWMQMSAAPRYAADNGYVLIAPEAHNSFYTDMRYGSPYYTALTELLPRTLHRMFKLPQEREKNFVCGLSMGGYGALRFALSRPERYAAAGSFSGAIDMAAMLAVAKESPEAAAIFTPLFGKSLKLPPEADLMALAKKVSKLPRAEQPRILCTCGRQDEGWSAIYTQNQHFRYTAEEVGLRFAYKEWDGVHEWNFWDRSLAEFIGFIQKSDYGERKRHDWATD